MLLAALFFGCAALVFAQIARSNNQGLILNRIIVLPPLGAAMFWWVLTALSAGFALVAALAIIHGIINTQRIVLTSRTIMVPASRWSSKEIAIPYVCIIDVMETRAKEHRFLKILHSDGEVEISSSMLPTMAAFDEILQILSRHIELLSTDELERHKSLVTVLSQSLCPRCGHPFTVLAAEDAVLAAERDASAPRRFVTGYLVRTELKDAPVEVKPFYPICCDNCLAHWWYGLFPRTFKARIEPDDS